MKIVTGTKTMGSTRLGMLAALVVLSNAQAQTTIDVAKITCEQFILLKVADPEKIAIWLSGFYHGKRDSTTIDVELLKEQAQKIRTYCLYKDRGATVMEAVERVLSPGR
jgi:acid stress chaperone HdeB